MDHDLRITSPKTWSKIYDFAADVDQSFTAIIGLASLMMVQRRTDITRSTTMACTRFDFTLQQYGKFRNSQPLSGGLSSLVIY